MSDIPTMGHNLPPITAPSPDDALSDLQARFPELVDRQAEFEAALATYPERDLTLADEEVAASLQDVLGQMKKHKTLIGAHKKDEKKPWDGVVKVVQNFFSKHDEKLTTLIDKWQPRHEAFLQAKKDAAKRAAEEEAERQRKEAERLRLEAEAQAERARQAAEAEAAARRREEEARARAEQEEQRRREAEAAAERAKAEERRIADERRQRERAEKEQNVEAVRAIKRNMKDAERLHSLAEAEEGTEDEAKALDELIRPGGTVSVLAGPVASSHLLDDEQSGYMADLKTRLAALRDASNARYDTKERRRRAKEAKAAEEAEAAAAAERKRLRDEEEAKAAAAKAERDRLEEEAAAAKAAEREAKGEIRAARTDARGAIADQKDAGRSARNLESDADRTENRADRLDRKLGQATDADYSRTRGDLGTIGGLVRRWRHHIVDEDLLRAGFANTDGTFAPSATLARHFSSEDLNGAVYRWMRAEQGKWSGRERVTDALPGVVFAYESDGNIRT